MDLVDIIRRRFVHPHSYTKFLVIRALAKRAGASTFIEAGTFRAVNAERCAAIFRKVYTVELDPDLARAARERLACRDNCEVIEGDAGQIVPELLSRDDVADALVLLDAHPCGSGTASGEVADPAIEALERLASNRRKIRAIVIDDFRLFGAEAGFPEKWRVIRAAEELYARHGFVVSVFLDQVIVARAES